MNKKVVPTRTIGQLHFEDLDPHRFEDLIRELIYDFRNWQTIEATGRLGTDDGFDIRAYEKNDRNSDLKEDDEIVGKTHPMQGNLWMIQVKREKSITPKKIENILEDVNSQNPPYGYILAASTNFSKKSRDYFRQELINKGVTEFYIFGCSELEDMLLLPKNDRILFTFFGISLTTKRRSIISEIKSSLIIKNKIYQIVGQEYKINAQILLRDLKDNNYPYQNDCDDFNIKPRWKEYRAVENHPLGIVFIVFEYYAYIDLEKKLWDYSEHYNFTTPTVETDEERMISSKKRNEVMDTWDFFPKKNKGYLKIKCLLRFADMEIIDPKGDIYFNMPHIFVERNGENSFFSKCYEFIKFDNEDDIRITSDFKKIEKFPKVFKKINIGKNYKDRKIKIKNNSNYGYLIYYSLDNSLEYLNIGDVISLENERDTFNSTIQITYKQHISLTQYLKGFINKERIKQGIISQLDRLPKKNEKLYVYEYRYIYNTD